MSCENKRFGKLEIILWFFITKGKNIIGKRQDISAWVCASDSYYTLLMGQWITTQKVGWKSSNEFHEYVGYMSVCVFIEICSK